MIVFKDLIDLFTKEGNDPQDIESVLRENNINKLVMKPDTDAMQEVAKSTNDWYKERKINN